MIHHLQGTVSEKRPDMLVLDVGGVGYGMLCSTSTLSVAPGVGERMRCLTRMVVREDSVELFGFATAAEREWFDKLVSVSSIGPRTAMGILGALPTADLALAVATGDAKAIQRAPGVGTKTAQRIVLELRDRVSSDDLVSGGAAMPMAGNVQRDAIEGLMALGFTQADAARAVQSGQGATAEEIILHALRGIDQKK